MTFLADWKLFAQAFGVTLMVSVLALLLALILGVFFGVMSTSSNPVLRGIARGYVETLQNTPLVLQAYVFYLALPYIGFMIGQMSWITDGASYDNASALETAISGGTRQYLLAIWFDTDFVNE